MTVTGGPFTMGQDGARGTRTPTPGVSVSDFELDASEVSVARFRRFWNAGHAGGARQSRAVPRGSDPVLGQDRNASFRCARSP